MSSWESVGLEAAEWYWFYFSQSRPHNRHAQRLWTFCTWQCWPQNASSMEACRPPSEGRHRKFIRCFLSWHAWRGLVCVWHTRKFWLHSRHCTNDCHQSAHCKHATVWPDNEHRADCRLANPSQSQQALMVIDTHWAATSFWIKPDPTNAMTETNYTHMICTRVGMLLFSQVQHHLDVEFTVLSSTKVVCTGRVCFYCSTSLDMSSMHACMHAGGAAMQGRACGLQCNIAKNRGAFLSCGRLHKPIKQFDCRYPIRIRRTMKSRYIIGYWANRPLMLSNSALKAQVCPAEQCPVSVREKGVQCIRLLLIYFNVKRP